MTSRLEETLDKTAEAIKEISHMGAYFEWLKTDITVLYKNHLPRWKNEFKIIRKMAAHGYSLQDVREMGPEEYADFRRKSGLFGTDRTPDIKRHTVCHCSKPYDTPRDWSNQTCQQH
jgi:hypothetical protein